MKQVQLTLCAAIMCVFLCFVHTQKSVRLPKLSTGTSELSRGIGNFSLTLMYHIAGHVNDNIITAPFSVWILMAALAEGASGATLDQLLQQLRIKKNNHRNTKYHYGELAKYLIVNTTSLSLERNSAFFADSSNLVKQNYVSLLKKSYFIDINSVDLKNSRLAVQLINNYVSHATHGRIKEVVSQNDLIDAKLVLTNAIYFKGQWVIPFNASETNLQPFYDFNGKEIGKVNMMSGRAVYPYVTFENLEASIIELPYGEQRRLSMLVILPYPGVSITKIFRNLKTVPLTEIFRKLEEASIEYEDEEVECWLPRFKISTYVSMAEPLQYMGIYDAFDPNYARFPKLSKRNLHVSQIFQKAEIEVTEEGTIAAAVTVATLANRISATRFKANRPFVFLIAEKITSLTVFAGIYSNPSVF